MRGARCRPDHVRAALASLGALALLAPARPASAQEPCCRAEGLEIAERYRVGGLDDRRFTHAGYWNAVAPHLASDRLAVTELGVSLEGRAIRAVTFGSGPTTVLLWSQMHGDESTATMALADLLRWLAEAPVSDELHRRLSERLTVVMVPMLNPDGAERFVRENAVGVDINRDARRLATPEGRILKAVRDSIGADFGFNLHDQGTYSAGEDGALVAIGLLAPAADEARSWHHVRQRARGVAAVIAEALATDLPGRVALYDDEFAPRAFGDNMQAWGTSTVLIESGVLPDDPQKQALRRMNVVAILSALDAIARGGTDVLPTAAYDGLPRNRAIPADLLVVGGTILTGTGARVRADVAVRFEDSAAGTGPTYGEIGDLAEVVAVDTLDASGLFLHADPGEDGYLRRGAPVRLTARRGPDPDSELVWRISGER
jgi:hypothetical protein